MEHQPNLAVALDVWYEATKSTPQHRSGLHASDLTSKQGEVCSRFAFLLLQGAPEDPVRLFGLRDRKRFDLGDAMHEMTFRRAPSAVSLQLGGPVRVFFREEEPFTVIEAGLPGDDIVAEVHIEVPVHFRGLVATPDVVIKLPNGSSHIIDVKSVDDAKLLSMQTKLGVSVPTEYRRQVLIYQGMVGASTAAIFWVVVADALKDVRHLQTSVADGGKVWEETLARLNELEELEPGTRPRPRRGNWCVNCKVRTACGVFEEAT